MSTFTDLSNDQLEAEIVTWSGRIAAGEAHLLTLIAEFDRREAWAGPGLLSCAHWLSWRTGLGPVAARERVRVGRALDELPLVREAHAAGRLSYSQVRAITRVATAQEQQRWIEMARSTTAGQLERLVRGVRRVHKVEEDAADPELAAWRMEARRSYDADGNVVFRIVLPAEQAAVLDAALDVVRAALERDQAEDASAGAGPPQPDEETGDAGASAEARSPQPEPAAASPTLTDAFLAMARTTPDPASTESPAAARRSRSRLTAQVDPLTGWGRLRDGELLPPSSLSAVLRTLPVRGGKVRLRRLTPADLRRHDLGRSQRLPSAALRELLGAIDGECCRFPGCTRRRKLHAHHVEHWSDGGTTDLDNLLLVCGRHHTLIHQLGFQLVLHRDRRLSVATAEGVAVLHHPGLPWRPATELDPDRSITAATLPPDTVEPRMDLGYAVMVLLQQSA